MDYLINLYLLNQQEVMMMEIYAEFEYQFLIQSKQDITLVVLSQETL
jgi:hypothetical protein